MMVAIHVEILVALPEPAIDPEAPDTLLRAGEQDRPATTIIHFDTVLVESRAEAERSSFHPVLAVR